MKRLILFGLVLGGVVCWVMVRGNQARVVEGQALAAEKGAGGGAEAAEDFPAFHNGGHCWEWPGRLGAGDEIAVAV